jgi:hypothetical protein
VVVHLDAHADRLQRQHHVGADVLELVHRRNREVALLVARLVTEVGPVGRPLETRIPVAGFGIDEVEAIVVALVEADGVEEEELELRTDIDGISDARLLDVRFGLLGDVARIARVGLARDRILDVADQHERRHSREGVHLRRRRVGHQQHVGFVDGLESADGRAVESETVLEDALAQLRDGNREMLPEAREVDEPEVHDSCALFLGQFQHVLRVHAFYASLVGSRDENVRAGGRRAQPATTLGACYKCVKAASGSISV